MVEVVPGFRGDPISGRHSFARIIPALFGQFSFALDQDNECSEYGVPKAPKIIKHNHLLVLQLLDSFYIGYISNGVCNLFFF